MPNKSMIFRTDILPYSDGEFNLGNAVAKWKINGVLVSDASSKSVDTSIAAGSTSNNLPTSAAVAAFVEGKEYLAASLKGANNGLAELNENGKIPSSQLPAYVDDVLEFSNRDNFPLTGSSGIIYVDTNTNKTYRWGGSEYVEISESLALGTNSTSAFRGDYGEVAYAHATDDNRLTIAQSEGLYKISTTEHGHIKSINPVTKADLIALGISDTDNKVAQEAAITTDSVYPILLANSNTVATEVNSVNKTSTLKYNPNTKELSTGGAINGYVLAAASAKNVTDITTQTEPNALDENLITGRTLYNMIASISDIDALFSN